MYFLKDTNINWNIDLLWQSLQKPGGVYTDIDSLVKVLKDKVESSEKEPDHVVFMSNGGFGGIQKLFIEAIASNATISSM